MSFWLTLVLAWVAVFAPPQTATVPSPPQPSPLDRMFAGRTAGDVRAHLATGEGDVDLPDPVMPGARAFAGDALGRLTNTVCRANLIAVGTWVDVTPHLNADESAIYSEWRFRATSVLKSRAVAVRGAEPVTIYLRGGAMAFGARTVRVANRDFARGLEPGAEFLVFAEHIPDTTALVAVAGFRIDGSALQRASRRSRYPTLESLDRDAALSTIRDVLQRTAHNRDCSGAP